MKGKKHPEIQEGEVFLGNLSNNDYYDVIWKTKRRGV